MNIDLKQIPGGSVKIFENTISLISAEAVLVLLGASVVLAQAPTPQQVKDSMQGLSKEQIRDKYMKLAAKNLHFADSWPINFPLPKYSSNVVDAKWLNTTKGRPTAVATLHTKDSPQTVFKFYQDACIQSGWKTKSPTAKALEGTKSAGNFFMLEGSKDKQMIRLFCSPNAKLHGTTVSITWFKVRQAT
ncbi:MAG: hypothetical protein JST44_06485 [Cyanobacteria bacterium SZAS LIN-5]|nr:hypothetical protein [Cyanobacteria bacterium SZAS LIN-5]